MIDREKVIKGLEHCLSDEWQTCTGCPYNPGYTYDDPHSGCQGSEEPMRDALALLKAQGPRVMTLEEVKSLERDAVVWYEHDGVNKQRPRIVDQVYDRGIIFTDGGHWQFNADAYGKKFRLWTSRPTDEQREAVEWE